MSGPHDPQDSDDSTKQWAPSPPPSSGAEQGPAPTQAFGTPQQGQPAGQQWGQQGQQTPGQPQQGQPQWGQQPGQGQTPGQQWGQQPGQGQQWGQPQQGQPQWGQPAQGQQWGQQGQQTPGQPQQGQPQWGQQPGQGQQWGQPQQGQPQWGQQPGQQWGSTGASQWNAGAPQQKSKTGLIVGLAVAGLVVIGAIIGAVLLLGGNDTLDPEAAQAGVEKVLTESYGATDVSDVQCPDGEEVKAGNSFECTLTVDGQFRSVTVTFTDDEGTYEVSRPN
ncbi:MULTISPECIES: DUF4333 domain-containing protein [Rhodococcus]|jgi:hypothetical protein|uniref:DUF4333 domain-containing protein n=3 Tax=Rhodococcus TaxID=1827 RepID=A0A059MQL8_9NOCA|nr:MULTISPECIES: DUF4333 domain-containing protein [Rhodococcus]ETT24353.1 protein of unknown function DUF4333 [Rhodococcus rhodochrous ATCC 21198]ANZ25137.1 hypothetical protein A4U64_10970 [Rhodococcus sp. WB1]KDE13282.1 hypothetical protein N505_0110900 [Rhodococcus aetherivorans]MBC2587653.1 DUF4333 domain-containing protein [Rhodococcus aetherivorans]MDV6292123.1 DUF4333 domain-containing protein [Rhodococcus aetherivorans]